MAPVHSLFPSIRDGAKQGPKGDGQPCAIGKNGYPPAAEKHDVGWTVAVWAPQHKLVNQSRRGRSINLVEKWKPRDLLG